MNKQPHDSGIDYLEQAEHLIGRKGKAYNICSGCLHTTEICACANDCWAKKTIKGRLRHNKGYPYGTQPTFRPEMVKAVGKRSRLLIALNFMGDVGGKWGWHTFGNDDGDAPEHLLDDPQYIAGEMRRFALLNPDHILLLLTKRPEWYGLVEWPENCWLGFSATNNEEYLERWSVLHGILGTGKQICVSLEPYLDDEPPDFVHLEAWYIIGGLSGPNVRPVSRATLDWLRDDSIKARRFTKANALPFSQHPSHFHIDGIYPREYPDSWEATP